MDDSQAFGLGVMRVRIGGVGFAVCSPTRMGDSDSAVYVFGCAEGLQFGHFAFGFIDIELSLLIDERHTGTVVAPVLETMQAFN